MRKAIRNLIPIVVFLALFSSCSGESNPSIDRSEYRVKYEVTSDASSLDITVTIPSGTTLPTFSSVSTFPWSYEAEGSVSFDSPDILSLSATGLIATGKSITTTIYFYWESLEDSESQSVTNNHDPANPTSATIFYVALP
jgi:hypothetical protein